tara:strand:+ start:273 stop:449 length:177 start_codon:yes stop_codon:yes gene_type:complete
MANEWNTPAQVEAAKVWRMADKACKDATNYADKVKAMDERQAAFEVMKATYAAANPNN